MGMPDLPQQECQKAECSFETKQELLKMSEIGIWVDSYDDIFSDFDPRPYSERALSDDFLNEAKKAARYKTSGIIGLKFLIPSAKRDERQEAMIKKRLHEHFKRHHRMVHDDIRNTRLGGIGLLLIGFLLMVVATYLDSMDSKRFVTKLLFVMLEPSGWFMAWYGFEQIFNIISQKRPDLDFYDKMSRCEIHFTQY